ncbi:MAG: trigger factor [Phycisphaerales bacterium]
MSSSVTESSNTVQVSDAGPSRKRLRIEVPADTVSAKLRESMEAIVASAELPGFRRGKVPPQLIEKRFGTSVRNEARGQLLTEAYQKAVEETKLRVVGNPFAENMDKIELVAGKPVVFELDVEIVPEFTLPSLDGIAIKKPIMEVTETLVGDELKKIAINEGDLESREVAEPGDYITGHAVMVDTEGTKFYDLQGAVVQSPPAEREGKGMILGIMVENFSTQLGSPKAGDTVTITAKGPDGHEVEKIRGADLTITFKAERVDRILPASTDKLVEMFGVASEDKLKEMIRERLSQHATVQQQSAMRSQVERHLAQNTQMALPSRLTAEQSGRVLERRRLELMYRGVDAQKIEEHMAELRAASSATAAHDLKMFFIMTQASEDLNVRVSDSEINGRIAAMAFQRNVRPEQLRNELIKTGQISGIYTQIRDHKVADAVIAKAVVEELSLEEFNKTMKDDGMM